jgi:hypothetical protein
MNTRRTAATPPQARKSVKELVAWDRMIPQSATTSVRPIARRLVL